MSEFAERLEAFLTKILNWRYIWNMICAVLLLYSSNIMQTSYWRFEFLRQLESPYPQEGILPRLELSPLAAMLFTGFVAVVAATYPLSQTKGRTTKILFGNTLLLICSVFPLLYLRYGISPPLNMVDQIVTVIFFGIYFSALMAIICTIASCLEEETASKKKGSRSALCGSP